MSLAIFNSATFITTSGLAVGANATIEVRRESDNVLAAIWSNEAGSAPITNPSAFADSSGRFQFYALGLVGGYKIIVTKGAESYTLRNVAIGTAGQYDATALLNTGYAYADAAVAEAIRSYAPNPFFEVDQLVNSATAVADDNYGHDQWYALTQTASIQISTQTLQENGQTTNARLSQNQAAAQRMGYACIIEAAEAKKLRGKTMMFAPRLRISNSQAIRVMVVEWTGTADAVTSDIVNDWTSGTYSTGNFFIGSGIGAINSGALTPSAAAWTDAGTLCVINSNVNNLILFVFTEGTAAQNVTLDIGKVRFVPGSLSSGEIYRPTFAESLRYAQRFYEKSFPYATAPAQNAGTPLLADTFVQAVGAAAATSAPITRFAAKKISAPSLTLYNPSAANALIRNTTVAADTSANSSSTGEDGFSLAYTSAAGSAAGNLNSVHWAAASRL